MKRKIYRKPVITLFTLSTHSLLMASQLSDPSQDEQNITPTDEEYGGEFQSRRKDVWEDEEEEEEKY
ncbi:MAG: hypothetical protein J6I52_09275 [Prevotella sp.]|nr:hypothetical protein [Prevotella sp.]